MRKKIFLTFLLIIIAFAGIYCSKKPKAAAPQNNYGLLNFISADALFVFKIKDLTKTYNEFLESDFYYNLMNYEIVQAAEKHIQTQDLSAIEKELGFKPSFKQFIDLVGKDLIVSVSVNEAQPIVKALLKYDETSKPLLEKLDRTLPEKIKNSSDINISESDYKGYKIKTVRFMINDLVSALDKNRNVRSESSISYFMKDGILAFSNDIKGLEQVIDLTKGDADSKNAIVVDPLFTQTFSSLDLSSQIIAYFKMKEISQSVIKYLAAFNLPDIDKSMKSWELVNATGATFDLKAKTIIKSYTVFNQETENQKLLKLMQKKAGSLQTPNLIPINALLYLSSNLVDAKIMFESYREYFNEQVNSEINKFLDNFKKNVKFDFVNDVLDNIGGEMSLAMFDINLSLNPSDALNSFAVITEIKDKKKLDNILKSAVKSSAPNMSIEKEIYKKSDVFKFVDNQKRYMKNNVSYAYNGDYLILSSYDTLRKMLDASEDENKTILAKAKVSELKDKIKQSNSFIFFDFRQFIKNLRDITDSLSMFFDPQDKYYTLYAVPVFDMLSYLDTISGYSKNDDNGVFSEMFVFMSTPENLIRQSVAAGSKKTNSAQPAEN